MLSQAVRTLLVLILSLLAAATSHVDAIRVGVGARSMVKPTIERHLHIDQHVMSSDCDCVQEVVCGCRTTATKLRAIVVAPRDACCARQDFTCCSSNDDDEEEDEEDEESEYDCDDPEQEDDENCGKLLR